MSKHQSLTTELLALRIEDHSAYEDHLLDVIGKLYGLISALQMALRVASQDPKANAALVDLIQ